MKETEARRNATKEKCRNIAQTSKDDVGKTEAQL